MPANFEPFAARMRADGLAESHIAFFARRYEELASGSSGQLPERELTQVGSLPRLADLKERVDPDALRQTVCLKLNGGLGTSMGLHGPKSLLPVREGLTFLDFAARQVQNLKAPAFMLMNSFHTRDESLEALRAYPGVSRDLPVELLQSRVPKVRRRDLAPAEHPDPELTWCPPGHGDLYPTLWSSGLLEKMLERGYRYLFVSNVDNVGATLDVRILAHFASSSAPLLMEVAQRTHADRKGGHLARRRANGELLLREVAQCPPDELDAFQDIDRYEYFNTNNLWLRLESLYSQLKSAGGFLDLPLIVNRKTVDPSDPDSEPVYQLESAMGSALGCLKGSQGLVVDRSRFLPVKNTNDLLLVRSDFYRLTSEPGLERAAPGENPLIDLDSRYYAMYDDFEARIPSTPSLRQAVSLTVRGDFTFGREIVVQGVVRLESDHAERIPDGSVLSGR
ncbi:MAG: UTP--glucose-1-phosphate uridylyltransferase [Candidatus Xenobia bacterium]